jgi:hypothetical protein
MSAEMIARVPTIPAGLFAARFAPVAASAQGLTAATADVLADELVRRVEAGSMTGREAERLGGFLAVRGAGLSRATRTRRRSELRKHGLVLADPLSDPVSVDLAEGIEAAVEAWS